MAAEVEVLRLAVQTRRREVLRYMGYPRARVPGRAVLERLDALWPEATSLVQARGAFMIVGRSRAESVGVPHPTDTVALCVCTIGSELEEQQGRYDQPDDALASLIVDAFGSAAAEACAEVLQARVCAEVQSSNLTAQRRLSPGYGNWDVRRQVDLLAGLPLDRLGMRLTDGCMMVPRKSVSFAALLAPPDSSRPRARCAACDRVDCSYRVDETGQ